MAVLPVLRGGHLAPLRNLVAGRPAGSWLRCLSETSRLQIQREERAKMRIRIFLITGTRLSLTKEAKIYANLQCPRSCLGLSKTSRRYEFLQHSPKAPKPELPKPQVSKVSSSRTDPW